MGQINMIPGLYIKSKEKNFPRLIKSLCYDFEPFTLSSRILNATILCLPTRSLNSYMCAHICRSISLEDFEAYGGHCYCSRTDARHLSHPASRRSCVSFTRCETDVVQGFILDACAWRGGKQTRGRWRRPSLLNKSSAARCSPCPCPHNIRRPPPTPCALLSAATLLHCGCSQFAGRCAYSCMGKRQLRWLLKWCIRHAGVPKLAGEEPAIFFFQPVREPSPSSSCTHPLAY